MYTIAIIILGALCGGFVTGLAGFSTGWTALGFWLYVVDPVVAAALVVMCSVVGQVQSLSTVRRAVTWQRVWPFLLGGLVGVPLGVAALRAVDPKPSKGCSACCSAAIPALPSRTPALTDGSLERESRRWAGRVWRRRLGGVAGLSGPLPTIWCGLRGWQADAQRGLYQPYNLTILERRADDLCDPRHSHHAHLGAWLSLRLPATLLGAYGGMRLYGRIDDQQFRYLVLWLLLVSGLGLTASNLL